MGIRNPKQIGSSARLDSAEVWSGKLAVTLQRSDVLPAIAADHGARDDTLTLLQAGIHRANPPTGRNALAAISKS